MDFDATEQLNDLARQPQEPPKPAPKWNGWSAPLRAIPAAVAEVGAAVGETLKAFGQVSAATGTDSSGGMFATQAPREKVEFDSTRQKILTTGMTGESEATRSLRSVSDYYAPDPLTASWAEQTVFGLTRGIGKAVGYGLTTGPAAPVLFGLDEGLTQMDQLQRQGVDTKTAAKVGAVAGTVNAAGFLVPVAGKTLIQTAGLAALSGPASYIAQQSATREILRAADYQRISEQFDPFDPTGLAVSMLPFGFGAWASRSHFRTGKARDAGQPAGTPESRPVDAGRGDGGPLLQQHEPGVVPPDAGAVDAQGVAGHAPAGDGSGRPSDAVAPRAKVEPPPFEEAPAWLVGHDAVDAAMVHNLTMAADASRAIDERIASPAPEPGQYDTANIRTDSTRTMPNGNLGVRASLLEDGRVVGKVETEETADSVTMRLSMIEEDSARGKGIGLRAYLDVIDQAHRAGKEFRSDKEVTPEAQKVYQRLADLGYTVVRNPNITTDSYGRMYAADKGPVFRVTESPSSAIPRAATGPAKEPAIDVSPPQELGAQASPQSSPEAAPQGQTAQSDAATAPVAEPAGPAADALTQSVRQRADQVVAEAPNMVVGTREDGSPITAREALEQIRREALEGTDDELGGQDAPLLDAAIRCALSQGE